VTSFAFGVERRERATEKSTFMLRGLPPKMTADVLLGHLDLNEEGFTAKYDFFYLRTARRHALLSILWQRTTPGAVYTVILAAGVKALVVSSKACSIGLAVAQGKKANIKKHERSSVVIVDVPDDCKPMLFDSERRDCPDRLCD